MSRFGAWVAMAWLVMFPPSALAHDWPLLMRTCSGAGGDSPDHRIAACDILIFEGNLSDPDRARSFYNRGLANNLQGLHHRAIEDYGLAIRFNPNFVDAFSNRGATHYERGEYDRALEDFDHALRIDPNDPRARANRCEVLAKLGRQDARCRR